MNLYVLSSIVLVLGVVLTGFVFVSYRRRLSTVTSETKLSVEQVNSVFQSTPIERIFGYVLIAAIAYLILQTIRQGFDFAVLMLGATVFTGIVWSVDRWLTKKSRLELIQRAESDISDFHLKTDKSTLEPGLIENCRAFFPILVFVFVLRSFIVEPFQIPSGSMKPTLEIRDFILVNRFTYGIRMPITNQVLVPLGQPERGDVIVFKPPHEPDKNFIKRVVAVPGDRVQYDYSRKILRINGEVVDKELIERTSDEVGRYNLYLENMDGREYTIYTDRDARSGRSSEWLPLNGVVVPEGKYFVMGDNRDRSQDARYWEGLRRSLMNDPLNEGNNAWGFVDENAILGEAFVIWMHWERFYPTFSRAGKIQ